MNSAAKGWMVRALAAVTLALGLSGCRLPHAPRTLWVDPGFSVEERAVLDDALAAWCEAVAWCPEVVEDRDEAEAAIGVVDDFEARYPDRVARGSQAFNDGETIRVAPYAASWGLDALWHVFAHELGHFCVAGHVGVPEQDNLMATTVAVDADGAWLLSTSIDAAAIEAWRAGCGE